MLLISFWIWPQEMFPPRRSQEQILGCISSIAQRGSSLWVLLLQTAQAAVRWHIICIGLKALLLVAAV